MPVPSPTSSASRLAIASGLNWAPSKGNDLHALVEMGFRVTIGRHVSAAYRAGISYLGESVGVADAPFGHVLSVGATAFVGVVSTSQGVQLHVGPSAFVQLYRFRTPRHAYGTAAPYGGPFMGFATAADVELSVPLSSRVAALVAARINLNLDGDHQSPMYAGMLGATYEL